MEVEKCNLRRPKPEKDDGNKGVFPVDNVKLPAEFSADAIRENPIEESVDSSMRQFCSLASPKRAPSVEECNTKDAKQMSYDIGIEAYHSEEEKHPGYIIMRETIIERILSRIARLKIQDPVILEVGSGTGLFTKYLANHIPEARIIAVEIDKECLDKSRQWLFEQNDKGKQSIQNVQLVLGDAIKHVVDGGVDIAVSTFSHHHIPYHEAMNFRRNMWNNLRDDGMYIVGDEIVPRFSNEKERVDALKKFHHHIIMIAEEEHNFRLAQIEYDALCSGVALSVDFKRHLQMMKTEMTWTIEDWKNHLQEKLLQEQNRENRQFTNEEQIECFTKHASQLVYNEVTASKIATVIFNTINGLNISNKLLDEAGRVMSNTGLFDMKFCKRVSLDSNITAPGKIPPKQLEEEEVDKMLSRIKDVVSEENHSIIKPEMEDKKAQILDRWSDSGVYVMDLIRRAV